MAGVFGTYDHEHCSEREPGRWEDCLWCSAVMVLRFGGLQIPSTLEEAEALRAASGEPETGPSSPHDLVRGAQKRYGVDIGPVRQDWTGFKQGTGIVATGRLANFPRTHTLRRWDPDYMGGHGVALFKLDSLGRYWWDDPLAPEGDYLGQWVSSTDVARFRQLPDSPEPFITVTRGAFGLPDTDMDIPDPEPEVYDVIATNFAGTALGEAKIIRSTSAFDLERRTARSLSMPYSRNVVAEVTLAERLSRSLPAGEPMLLTTFGEPDRFELIRTIDTDWPRGRAGVGDAAAQVKTAVNGRLDRIGSAVTKERIP